MIHPTTEKYKHIFLGSVDIHGMKKCKTDAKFVWQLAAIREGARNKMSQRVNVNIIVCSLPRVRNGMYWLYFADQRYLSLIIIVSRECNWSTFMRALYYYSWNMMH